MANALSRKYFSAPSIDSRLRLANAASTKIDSELSSMPTKTITRSTADATSSPPSAEKASSA